jgi:hypothetical protein
MKLFSRRKGIEFGGVKKWRFLLKVTMEYKFKVAMTCGGIFRSNN